MTDPIWSARVGGRPEAQDAWRSLGPGCGYAHSRPAPTRDPGCPNEDGGLLVDLGDGRVVIAVADGVGGMAVGDLASAAALAALEDCVRTAAASATSLREGVLAGFDAAQLAVPRQAPGGATTLAVVTIEARELRSYHAGDSLVLVVGQRGHIHHQNVSHSPVGYAVEAGLLDENDALHHEQRHVISNAVGTDGLHIEVGPRLDLSARDTVLLASDGLSDNLDPTEIVELIRRGSLATACTGLVERATRRMTEPTHGQPSKPDDLTVVAYRPTRQRGDGSC